jgi:putative hydrolase of the HAD superfamily
LVFELKAVLFDIDDTLFDRQSAQKATLELMVKKHPALLGGIDHHRLWTAWTLSDDLSTRDFEAGSFVRVARCRHFLRLLDLADDQSGLDLVKELTDQYLADYTSLNLPVAGAGEVVRELVKSVKVGVVSNSLADVQYGKLNTLGLTPLLSCIVLSEEFGVRKPDPAIFQRAAQLSGVTPSDCLFVGDSYLKDMLGARAAGMLTCWLNRFNASPPEVVPGPPSALIQPDVLVQQPDKIRPDFVISTLEELLPLLRKNLLIK